MSNLQSTSRPAAPDRSSSRSLTRGRVRVTPDRMHTIPVRDRLGEAVKPSRPAASGDTLSTPATLDKPSGRRPTASSHRPSKPPFRHAEQQRPPGPAAPGRASKPPTLDRKRSGPVRPRISVGKRPAPVRLLRPSDREKASRPAATNTPGPAAPQRPSRPVALGRPLRPATLERAGAVRPFEPSAPEKPSKPAASQTPSSPASSRSRFRPAAHETHGKETIIPHLVRPTTPVRGRTGTATLPARPSSRPVASHTRFRPASPERPFRPSGSETSRPAALGRERLKPHLVIPGAVRLSKPSRPGATDRPRHTAYDKPSRLSISGRPVTPQRPYFRPALDSRLSRPAGHDKRSRPAAPERPSRPAASSERAARPGTLDRPSIPSGPEASRPATLDRTRIKPHLVRPGAVRLPRPAPADRPRPTTPDRSSRFPVSNRIPRPPASQGPFRPAPVDRLSRPAAPDQPLRPAASDRSSRRPAPDRLSRPVTPDRPSRPAVPNRATVAPDRERITPDDVRPGTVRPSKPGLASDRSKPAAPDRPSRPAISRPVASQRPRRPASVDRISRPATPDKQLSRTSSDRPSRPAAPDRPSRPSRPADLDRPSRPAALGRHSIAAAAGRTFAPELPNRPSTPATPDRERIRPVIPGAVRPSSPSRPRPTAADRPFIPVPQKPFRPAAVVDRLSRPAAPDKPSRPAAFNGPPRPATLGRPSIPAAAGTPSRAAVPERPFRPATLDRAGGVRPNRIRPTIPGRETPAAVTSPKPPSNLDGFAALNGTPRPATLGGPSIPAAAGTPSRPTVPERPFRPATLDRAGGVRSNRIRPTLPGRETPAESAGPSRPTPVHVHGVPIDNGVIGDAEIQCGPRSVTVIFNTENPFDGNVFVKGHFNDPVCRVTGDNSRLAAIELPFDVCGVTRQRSLNPKGVFVMFTLVVSFHHTFLTKIDRAVRVQCFYMEADKTVDTELEVSAVTSISADMMQVPMPVCRYEILDGGPTGSPIRFALIGQQVYHKWTCDTDHPDTFCMIVYDCFVDDGTGDRIQIIDQDGCALDRYILNNLEYPTDLMAGREAHVFKYADRSNLYFNCQIRIDVKDPGVPCARPTCPALRRVKRSTGLPPADHIMDVSIPSPILVGDVDLQEDDVPAALLHPTKHIMTHKLAGWYHGRNSGLVRPDSVCMSAMGFGILISCGSVFIIATLTMATLLCIRKPAKHSY